MVPKLCARPLFKHHSGGAQPSESGWYMNDTWVSTCIRTVAGMRSWRQRRSRAAVHCMHANVCACTRCADACPVQSVAFGHGITYTNCPMHLLRHRMLWDAVAGPHKGGSYGPKRRREPCSQHVPISRDTWTPLRSKAQRRAPNQANWAQQ